MQIAVVSTRTSAALARMTVRFALGTAAGSPVHVLDVDGTYLRVGNEIVGGPQAFGLSMPELRRLAVELDAGPLVRLLAARMIRALGRDGEVTVLLSPGVALLQPPTPLVEGAMAHGVCLLARADRPFPADERRPDARDLAQEGGYSPHLLAVRGAPAPLLDLWEHLATAPDGPVHRWLDVLGATLDHSTVRDAAALVSWWSLHREHDVTGQAAPGARSTLRLDGREIVAIDLRHIDTDAPWLLHAHVAEDPRARLSDHPTLARLVEQVAADLQGESPDVAAALARPDAWDVSTTALGTTVDRALTALYAGLPATVELGHPDAPDPFDRATADRLLTWLTDPSPDGGPGRYLLALHGSRPDLRDVYAAVPGADEAGFLRWVAEHAVAEGYAETIVARSLAGIPERAEAEPHVEGGVTVVGFLRGELGIGESARLLVSALQAADFPHSTATIDRHLASRQNASPGGSGAAATVYDTSVLCVNADLTSTIARSARSIVAGGYRIGMWYWEVEEFPASQHTGFAHVDEVWVATDFVRDAVEPHSPVPVRVLTPPLPQRGSDPRRTRADLGLPDRPYFLFSFDYLSTADRKNPLGLLDAFSRAFRPGEGPALVLKSINAEKRSAEAEHVRLVAAANPDVLVMEQYLNAEDRDALVALCDCYVSLHRSEGLGLTIAEAMAWGKPVVATAYSGNMQFMTQDNSFLVPWSPVAIPPGADPYPTGGTWAEPDLDAAAAAMRAVLEQPEVAAARGARAAADIRTLHSPEVAGHLIVARLQEIGEERRASARAAAAAKPPPPSVASRLRGRARQTLRLG